MTQARTTQISLADTPYYHCIARCVRRAFLCGVDDFSGRDYEHRRQWIVDKLRSLAGVFAIDICAYAVMSNHYHVVLRVNEHTAKLWQDSEVIERWTTLFSAPVLIQRYLKGEANSPAEIAEAGEIVALWRTRLTDISWFMRCLNESIARRANREDECKGRFWEGRFRSQALLDHSAVLACMAYVDLNPIRAGLADCPEKSDFTSIQARLRQYADTLKTAEPDPADPVSGQPADLLSFVGGEHVDAPDGIAFALPDYLHLVDWTGRAVREDKRGAIPADLQPILQRLGLNESEWLETVQHFGRRYRLAAGAVEKLQAMGERLRRRWIQGVGFSRRSYRQAAESG